MKINITAIVACVVTSLTITACAYRYNIQIEDPALPNPSVLVIDPENPDRVPEYAYVEIFVTIPESEFGTQVWDIGSEDKVAVPNPLVLGKAPSGFKTRQTFSGFEPEKCYRLLVGSAPGGTTSFCVTEDNKIVLETRKSPSDKE